ncbi:hypothetical protein ACOSP7_027318 [Xanthoceras sorbifolium]
MEESGVASQDYGLWLRATSSSRSLPSRPRRDGHNETGRGAPRDVIALSPTLGTGQKMVSREERVVVNVVKALEAQPTVCKDLRGGVPGLATSRRTVDLGKAPTIAIMGVYGLAPALAGNICEGPSSTTNPPTSEPLVNVYVNKAIRGKGVSSNSVEVCNDHTGSLPMKEFGDTFIFKSVAMKTGIEDSGSVTDGGGKPKAMELDRKFSKWKRCARERVNGSSKLSGSLMSLGKRSQSSFGVQDVETLKKARGLDVSVVFGGRRDRLLCRFHFQESWVKSLGFGEIVEDNWFVNSVPACLGRVTQSISSCVARLAS